MAEAPEKGLKRKEVEAIQEQLSKMDYYSGPIDGLFGKETQVAVESFQQAHGIPADGIVDPQTQRALSMAESESGSVGISKESIDKGIREADDSGETDLSKYHLSVSVKKVIKNLQSQGQVGSADIIQGLLELHREYANSKASDLELAKSEIAKVKAPIQWIEEIRTLFELGKKRLDGRIAIYGLSLLDRDILEQLDESGFLPALLLELESRSEEPFDNMLTEKGRALKNARIESVPILQDLPAEVDLLGREAFAQAIARRIRNNRQNAKNATTEAALGAFLVHIHGPWGAGKSTLLNFIRRHLESKSDSVSGNNENSRWITVQYNAWQYQRLSAPWWFLLKMTINQSVRELIRRKSLRAVWVWLGSFFWRSFHSQGRYLFFIPLFVWLVVIAVGLIWPSETSDAKQVGRQASELLSGAKGISALLAVLVTLWSIVKGIGDTVFHGSARAAKSFIESSHDPMGRLSKHFEKTIRRIHYPVAILIDDLDRCQGAYAIELLEAIQTLFRSSWVVFIIAADRRWLIRSYRTAYASYRKHISEPGRPLGYLFMEKTFQLSAAVPRISSDLQKEYWEQLLGEKRRTDPEVLSKARTHAAENLRKLSTEYDVIRELDHHKSDSIEDHAFRQEAMLRLSTPEIEEQTAKHILTECGQLLEPNPRTMIRMVNEYGTRRALDILRGGTTDQLQLALWTILSLQWPQIAGYLEDNPEFIEYFSKEEPPDMPTPNLEDVEFTEDLRMAIRKVVMETDTTPGLTKCAIQACTGLRTQETSQA